MERILGEAKVILYKLNHNNNVSWWKIEQHGKCYTVSWGQDHTRQSCQSMNQNTYETPSPERAVFEIQSRINEQIKRCGFTENIPTHAPDLPMLAQKWEDHYSRVRTGKREDFERFAIQPKLDGLRCLATKDSMASRRNVKIGSCPHVQTVLASLPDEIRLDGELYIHNTDLQTVQSYVRNERPHKLCKLVEYRVFDLVDTELPFEARQSILNDVVEMLRAQHQQQWEIYATVPPKLRTISHITENFPIQIVPTTYYDFQPCSEQGLDTIKKAFKQARKDGYEGVMVRKANHDYEMNYRSPDLLKFKERLDDEFEVIDVSEGYGSTGIFVCKTEEGAIFEATPAWTRDRKRRLLVHKEKYIGKMVTVEYETLSRDGIPLKPVAKNTRHKDD